MRTPLPPARTGVAHYASIVLPALAQRMEIVEDDADADAVIYQLGNNPFHEHIYAEAMRRPGVVVLHDLSLAGAYADRVALLDVGRLRALGTPLEVLTEQLIAEVYRLPVEVLVREGRPLIIPRRAA